MDSVKVSVIMPVYNGEKYLAEAIKSILTQSFNEFELIIIDDGSTDDSMAIVNSFADDRIRVLKNEKNLGLVKTRNRGLKEAQGEFIAMLDCDDVAMPERLSLQVNILKEHSEFGLVASQIILIDEKGKEKEKVSYKEESENIPAVLFFNNFIAQSSVMVRKTAIQNLEYREAYPPAEDYDLWVRLSRFTKIKIIQRPLVKYRIHSNNISFTKAQAAAEAVKKILRNQLELLKVKPSDAEFYIHTQIAQYEFKKSKVFINDCADWLVKLYQANKIEKVYSDKIFQQVLIKRFAIACGNSGLGFWGFTRFFKFPLLNFSTFNTSEVIKLFLKALISLK